MNKELQKKIEDFLKNADAESILKECEEWGIPVDYVYSDIFTQDPIENKFENKNAKASYNRDENDNYSLAA